MRTPDKNSGDNKLITALLGTYVPKSKMNKEQHDLYYRVVSLLIGNEKAKRNGLIKTITDEGIMSPKLRGIIDSHFSKPYAVRCSKKA